MELHSPSALKKLLSSIRIVFFMIRKGLISKRKLYMDIQLTLKRGKLLGKSLSHNLIFHHHSAPHRPRGEYEFSCTNSPNPVFFHAKRRHNYFPCINTVIIEEPDETPMPAVGLPRIEYSPQCSVLLPPGDHKASGKQIQSPLSVRVSDYSFEEEEEESDGSIGREVDDEAEEFIRRFYEQLRAQSRIALLQYQEMEYQEMLARGS